MRSSSVWLIVIIVALLLSAPLCIPIIDPNVELARTARDAIGLADRAVSQDQSAVLWSGRFRLLAVVLGVSIPLIVVYLICRSTGEREIEAAEVIDAIERYRLPVCDGQRPVDVTDQAKSLPVPRSDER